MYTLYKGIIKLEVDFDVLWKVLIVKLGVFVFGILGNEKLWKILK